MESKLNAFIDFKIINLMLFDTFICLYIFFLLQAIEKILFFSSDCAMWEKMGGNLIATNDRDAQLVECRDVYIFSSRYQENMYNLSTTLAFIFCAQTKIQLKTNKRSLNGVGFNLLSIILKM